MTTATISENNSKSVTSIYALNQEKFRFIITIFSIAIIILGVAYILLLNSLATKGFELEALKNERMLILNNLEKAEINAVMPTSIYALKSSEQVQSMANISKQKFLSIMEGQVAFK